MENNSQHRNLLIDYIREAYGRLTYTQRIYAIQASLYGNRHGQIKTLQAILSALTTGSLIPVVIGKNQQSFAIISALLSVSLSILNIYVRNHDLGEQSNKNKEVSDRLWLLREKYRSLLCDFEMGEISTTEARQRRDDLDQSISDIYSTSPITSQKAYRLSRKAIQSEESMYFSETELNQMLPEGFRKKDLDLQNRLEHPQNLTDKQKSD